MVMFACRQPLASRQGDIVTRGAERGRGETANEGDGETAFSLSHSPSHPLSHPFTLLEAGFRHSPSQTLSLSNDSDGLAMRMALLGIT